MIPDKQVSRDHYEFQRYVSKQRWASMWHQLDEVLATGSESVLEIGPGPGIFKAVGGLLGLRIDTLDIDPELSPDFIAPADQMPFASSSYDAACAFQMLEHLPFEDSLAVVEEMSRVARSHVIVSLPDSRPRWMYSLYVPKLGRTEFVIARPGFRPKEHEFNGEHFWEINKRGYRLERVVAEFEAAGQMRLQKSFGVPEFPLHHFLVFELT